MIEQLPKGWAEATVGDLGQFINGLAFKPSDWGTEGRPIIRIQNLTGQNPIHNLTTRKVDQSFIVSPGDILVSWSATLDVFVWRGPEAVLNQHIFRVLPSKELSEHRFVRWSLKEAIGEMVRGEHTHGSTMQHINRGPFLAHVLRLPPLREQQRIVDAIESYFTRLDDAMVTLERVQRNLKRYRASVLKAAVEGRLVSTEAELARAEQHSFEPASVLLERILAERRRRWETLDRKNKYQEPVAPDISILPALPEGWCWATIDQLTDGARSSGYGVLVPGPDVQDGVRLVRVGDINDGRVATDGLKRIDPNIAQQFKRTFLLGGEVLISLVGTIGRTAVVQPSLAGANVARAVGVIPITSEISPSWVEHWLRSPLQRAQMEGKAHEVARKTLNLEDVRAAHVALPPLEEQVRILDRVADLSSLCEAAERMLASSEARLARLRQSILWWAFDGKLANQDANDEPAAALLERIKGERSIASSSKQDRVSRASQRKTA